MKENSTKVSKQTTVLDGDSCEKTKRRPGKAGGGRGKGQPRVKVGMLEDDLRTLKRYATEPTASEPWKEVLAQLPDMLSRLIATGSELGTGAQPETQQQQQQEKQHEKQQEKQKAVERHQKLDHQCPRYTLTTPKYMCTGAERLYLAAISVCAVQGHHEEVCCFERYGCMGKTSHALTCVFVCMSALVQTSQALDLFNQLQYRHWQTPMAFSNGLSAASDGPMASKALATQQLTMVGYRAGMESCRQCIAVSAEAAAPVPQGVAERQGVHQGGVGYYWTRCLLLLHQIEQQVWYELNIISRYCWRRIP
jgi:hypothetical protein